MSEVPAGSQPTALELVPPPCVLPLASGAGTEILTWLDDHSRYALRITAHRRVSGPIVVTQFRAAAAEHGIPASTLTDIQDG